MSRLSATMTRTAPGQRRHLGCSQRPGRSSRRASSAPASGRPSWPVLAVLAALVSTGGCTTRVTGSAAFDQAAAPRPDPSCPGKVVPVGPHPDVASAVLAETPRHLPVDAKNSRAQPTDVVLEDFTDHEAEARSELAAADYRGGFQRTWSTGTPGTDGRQVELLVVYEFGSPDGACRFFSWMTKTLKLTPFSAGDVPGGVGGSTSTGRLRTTSIYASKARYVILAAALVYGTENVDGRTVDLIGSQYHAL